MQANAVVVRTLHSHAPVLRIDHPDPTTKIDTAGMQYASRWTQGYDFDSTMVRQRMVAKLQARGITHPQVLDVMGSVERHRFVESGLLAQAYEDVSLPIGWGQTISKPSMVARMLELLCQHSRHRPKRVLEIGTGCGYQAAVLGLLAEEVYSIERIRGLYERASNNLWALHQDHLHLLFGDGTHGYPPAAPYTWIVAAASGISVPTAWTDQLAKGGILVAPVTLPETPQQCLVQVEKTAWGLSQTVIEDVRFVPLKSGTVD